MFFKMGNSAINIDSLLLHVSNFAKQKNIKCTDQHFWIKARFPLRSRDISQIYLTVGTFFIFILILSQSYLNYLTYLTFLSILTGKNHSQVKLQRLQKVWSWAFG